MLAQHTFLLHGDPSQHGTAGRATDQMPSVDAIERELDEAEATMGAVLLVQNAGEVEELGLHPRELLGFVEHMTQVNRGRAFYSDPAQLGSFLMVDYLKGRRQRRA